MAGGRPTDYKPEYCQMLIEHMRRGRSFETFACDVNTHRGTLYDWCEKHKEFADAKKAGQELSYRFWETLVMATAAGKSKGSAAVIIFAMKNRFGWKNEIDVTYDVKGFEFTDGTDSL